MTRIEVVRFFEGPSEMMRFQRAFAIYLKARGYENFTHTLIITDYNLVICDIAPDLDSTQQADLTHQIETLNSVTAKQTPNGVEYVFA